jgi:hypothetical protein
MERVGVYIITSWPGATNIIAMLLDSTPMVAITGHAPHRISSTDAFEEMFIAEVTCSITKHNYQIFDVDDIPRVIHQRKTFGDHCIDFFFIVLDVIITTGLQEYVSLVLDHLDPDDKLFTYQLYHIACRDTRDNRLVKDG